MPKNGIADQAPTCFYLLECLSGVERLLLQSQAPQKQAKKPELSKQLTEPLKERLKEQAAAKGDKAETPFSGDLQKAAWAKHTTAKSFSSETTTASYSRFSRSTSRVSKSSSPSGGEGELGPYKATQVFKRLSSRISDEQPPAQRTSISRSALQHAMGLRKGQTSSSLSEPSPKPCLTGGSTSRSSSTWGPAGRRCYSSDFRRYPSSDSALKRATKPLQKLVRAPVKALTRFGRAVSKLEGKLDDMGL